MDIHLSYALCSVIGKLQTLSHQFVIEVGKYAQIPLDERICLLGQQGVESKEHCHCGVFYEMRGRYHCLFKQGFAPQGNGIWGPMMHGAFCARTQE